MTDSYIALDLETTGLEPKKEKITEIAALKVEHGQITGRFVTLVNPKRPLTERVVELTGITDDMLKDAPVIENMDLVPNCIKISREDLMSFYKEYKCILPDSITRWENLFS